MIKGNEGRNEGNEGMNVKKDLKGEMIGVFYFEY